MIPVYEAANRMVLLMLVLGCMAVGSIVFSLLVTAWRSVLVVMIALAPFVWFVVWGPDLEWHLL